MIDEQAAPKGRNSFWLELPILVGVAIVVALLVRAFLVQTFYIPSSSMEHTLDRNDRVLVNKLVYDFRSPERGEVIVFEAPDFWRKKPEEEDYIKRIIGVGGDRVVCCDNGQLTVNGQPLNESYVYPGDDAASREFDITVPEGRLWVMGDHRSSSADSLANYSSSGGDMQLSTIPEDVVIGRAFVLFWPFDRATWLTIPDTFAEVPATAPS